MVRIKNWVFFFGLKSRFYAKKSDFCHVTPILVNSPFLALGDRSHVGSNFLTFRSQFMAVFLKKKRSTRQKAFPLPTVGAPSTSNSPSALRAQALRARAFRMRAGKSIDLR